MKNFKGSIILLLTALIWGTAFVAQSVGVEHIPPFTFNGVRNVVGAIALLPVIFVMSKIKKKKAEVVKEDKKTLFIGGILCGVVLAVASTLQQFGLVYTTPGKAGFLTALYIIFVPLFSIILKKRVKHSIWLSVALATLGMYLLCVKESVTINKGDVLVFLCAIAFTFHIMVIDHFSPKVDGVKLSCIQFAVCAVLCLLGALIFDRISLSDLTYAAVPILYTGVMSSGVAYTLQIIGQKYTNPTLATLIMSLESVFAALAGWIILGQGMSLSEIAGAVLMFVSIIIAQFV